MRKMRHNGIGKNRVMRYLMYAFGEILLVVAGILIALQVNNWNEQRKILELEHDVLLEIRDNLVADEVSLKNDLRINGDIIKSTLHIGSALRENIPINDSLELHLGNLAWNTIFTVKKSGYENLRSAGFQVIQNDSLRRAITEMYETEYPFLMGIQEESAKRTWDYFLPRYLEFMDHVKFTGIYSSNAMRRYVPKDFASLSDNIEFHRLLSVISENKQEVNLSLNATIQRIINLRKKIEMEIKTNL